MTNVQRQIMIDDFLYEIKYYIYHNHRDILGKNKIAFQTGRWNLDESVFVGTRMLLFVGRRTEAFYLDENQYRDLHEMVKDAKWFIDGIAKRMIPDKLIESLMDLI